MSDLFQNAPGKLVPILRRIAHLILPPMVFVRIRKWRLWRQLKPRMRDDCARYLAYSGTVSPYSRKESYQARLTMHYHVIEKALSFGNPRPGYGQEAVDQLVSELRDYLQRFGPDDLANIVLDVLSAYHNFNLQHGTDNQELLGQLMGLKKWMPDNGKDTLAGGVLPTSRIEIQRAGRSAFEEFVKRRHSIRDFTNKAVPIELIQKAVEISLKSPSACNRQPWRVHCYQGREDCGRILQFQSGNRGFGDSIGTVLIVTCDLSAFFGELERHAAYIDGGMFAMSLVYALHALGLGTCCLNLSLSADSEDCLREAVSIGESEVLIMMIAVGELPETLRVAQSSRRPVSDILHFHGADEVSLGPKSSGSVNPRGIGTKEPAQPACQAITKSLCHE